MEKKEVTIGSPVVVAGLTLIPVIQILLNYWPGNSSTAFWGVKQPVAVVVVSPSAKRAFRITGEEISIDQLLQEASGLKEIVEEHS